MKVMKKILMAMCMAMMMVLVSACGSNASNGSAADNNATSSQSQAKSGNSKTLVVYYSATGRTKEAADAIAAATGADMFEIQPQQPYTDDDLNYRDDNSRVMKEHNDPNRHTPLKQNTPDNWANYDTVFVGYPIWWGDAAWVMDDFVKNSDFSGKTVIPFATSYSSDLGNSAANHKEMAGNKGNWLDGQIFKRDMTKDQVTDWVKSLNLKK